MQQKIVPVILCGGSGTRLWPLSRQETPKQFLRLLDEDTLLQKTAIRALQVLKIPATQLVTITREDMARETVSQLQEISPLLTHHVLREPEARNTAAAVAYAIRYVAETFGPDSCLWILPADHYIGDLPELSQAVEKACRTARQGYLVTFGINPTRAETGYGYIRKAAPLDGSGACRVEAFYEKPDQNTARSFFESGEYLWNSGMHLFTAETGARHFIAHAPDIWHTVQDSVDHAEHLAEPNLLHYRRAAQEPFETAVLEKAADAVAVIPCNPQWSDIGSWESLWEIRDKDGDGNACDGNVLCADTRNSMIVARERLVTCVGLEDVVVIETGDSILVANKNCGNALKNLVTTLSARQIPGASPQDAGKSSWSLKRERAARDNLPLPALKKALGWKDTGKGEAA